MLNFWYSERCTRTIKLIICISTCVVILLTAEIKKLDFLSTLMSLCLGLSLHIIHHVLIQSKRLKHQLKAYYAFSPFILIVFFIFMLSALNFQNSREFFALFVQLMDYSAVGLFVVSLYASRTPR